MMHVTNGKAREKEQNIAQSAQYDAAKLKKFEVVAYCASCAHDDDDDVWLLGTLVNAWEKVTGTRFMQCASSYKVDDKRISLGDSLSALKGTALEGW